MATYRRLLTPGATYFFTLVTQDRSPLLTEPQVVEVLRQAFREVRREYPFRVEAIVLLPDHLYCLWTLPDGDADYARRWNIVKRRVSQRVRHLLPTPEIGSQAARRELGLWQRRFWEHQIRDEADFERHANYLHWNPVKHGYVPRVSDWPWSSFHRHVERKVYPPDWGGLVQADESADYGEP